MVRLSFILRQRVRATVERARGRESGGDGRGRGGHRGQTNHTAAGIENGAVPAGLGGNQVLCKCAAAHVAARSSRFK